MSRGARTLVSLVVFTAAAAAWLDWWFLKRKRRVHE